jgi:hypothetical protein
VDVMARPKNTGAEWFDYSVHTLSDPKIDMLRLKHKADGFLFYMYMLEQIYRTEYYELDLSNDTDYVVEYYSLKMDITTKDFWDILETCFKVNLFDRSIYNSTKRLTSNGIKKRAVAIEEKREYDRKRYEKNKKGKSFHSENEVKTNENKVENSENEVSSQSFHNKRTEEKRIEENRTEQNIIKKNNCDSVADDDFLRSDFENENGCVASSADLNVGVGRVSDFKTLQQMTKRDPAELIRSGGILEKDEYCQISKKDIPEIMDIYAKKFPEIREILGTGISKVKLFEIMKSYPLAELTAICWKAKESAEQNPAGYIMKVLQDTPPNHFWYDEHLPKLEKIITKMYDKTGYGKAIFKNVEAM